MSLAKCQEITFAASLSSIWAKCAICTTEVRIVKIEAKTTSPFHTNYNHPAASTRHLIPLLMALLEELVIWWVENAIFFLILLKNYLHIQLTNFPSLPLPGTNKTHLKALRENSPCLKYPGCLLDSLGGYKFVLAVSLLFLDPTSFVL